MKGADSDITHTVNLKQVGLTILDSHAWHKLERLMTNCTLLLGLRAVISEGQVSP